MKKVFSGKCEDSVSEQARQDKLSKHFVSLYKRRIREEDIVKTLIQHVPAYTCAYVNADTHNDMHIVAYCFHQF